MHFDDEDMRRHRERFEAPLNEIGVPVPIEPVLALTDDVAVGLQFVRVYSTGVEVTLRAVSRIAQEDGSGPRIAGAMHPGSNDIGLLVGVEYSNGRTGTNLRPPGQPFPPDRGPGQPQLMHRESSSSGTVSTVTYFLTPLPPPGPLTIVIAWPACQIGETTIVLSGDEIVDAASHVVELWPYVEEEEVQRMPKFPDPELPPGGWFRRASGSGN